MVPFIVLSHRKLLCVCLIKIKAGLTARAKLFYVRRTRAKLRAMQFGNGLFFLVWGAVVFFMMRYGVTTTIPR